MESKDLSKIWNQAPPDYYQRGICTNPFQMLWHKHKFQVFRKLAPKTSGGRILDLGCAGRLMTNIIANYFPKSKVTKDGQAIIAMDSGNLLFRIIWWFWEKTFGNVWHGAHLHPFQHRDLEKVIKEVGFKITKKHFSHLGMEVSFVLRK